jgi:hypothetical protein
MHSAAGARRHRTHVLRASLPRHVRRRSVSSKPTNDPNPLRGGRMTVVISLLVRLAALVATPVAA